MSTVWTFEKLNKSLRVWPPNSQSEYNDVYIGLPTTIHEEYYPGVVKIDSLTK